ncbi:peptidoglycan-binding domain-containing protein [Streptomyces olivaceiscleroticus]|uniref:Peptidoglycan-binding domain-containing protein n=1 Tax=Streptomyces olivaceiscleroticus TaxID=68245 RepID=A0ABN0ZSA1_9ACTN
MTARNCPTCLAPARTGGRPGCRCEQAAAQDFDPLHIRPYVSLPDAPDPDDPPRPPRAFTVRAYGPPAFPPPSYVRVPRPPFAPPRTAEPSAAPAAEPHAAPLGGLPAAASGALPAPPGPLSAAPYPPHAPQEAGQLSRAAPGRRPDGLPVAGPVAFMDLPDEATGQAGDRPEPERRRRPVLLAGLMVTAAAGSVCAALFGGELHSPHETGLPLADGAERPAAGLPDGGAEAAGLRPTAPGAASRSAARPSDPRAATSAADTPFTRSPGAPTTRASGSGGEALGGLRAGSRATLSEGASGPEVTELQRRLAQLGLYDGPADGRYDAGVTASVARYQRTYGETEDPYGVYGPATRTSLEFLTHEP